MNGSGTDQQTTLLKIFEQLTALPISITSVTEYLLGVNESILDHSVNRSEYL